MWNYRRVEYLAIHSKIAIGILIDNFECTVWKETRGYSTNSVHLIW